MLSLPPAHYFHHSNPWDLSGSRSRTMEGAAGSKHLTPSLHPSVPASVSLSSREMYSHSGVCCFTMLWLQYLIRGQLLWSDMMLTCQVLLLLQHPFLSTPLIFITQIFSSSQQHVSFFWSSSPAVCSGCFFFLPSLLLLSFIGFTLFMMVQSYEKNFPAWIFSQRKQQKNKIQCFVLFLQRKILQWIKSF